MPDLFVMPVTPTYTLVPTGLGTSSDSSSVLFIIALGLGLVVLAVVGMYMMKMMKWA